MTSLWQSCERLLIEGATLSARLSPHDFRRRHQAGSGASVGALLRHCADHFDRFRRGIETGVVDYDDRRRGTAVERDPAKAADVLSELAGRYGSGAACEYGIARLMVRTDSGGGAREGGSTVDRELQFLVSHTVHHYTIIGILCQIMEIPLPEGFGVAASTLRFQREQAGV